MRGGFWLQVPLVPLSLLLAVGISVPPAHSAPIQGKKVAAANDLVGDRRILNSYGFPPQPTGLSDDAETIAFIFEFINYDDSLAVAHGSQLDLVLKLGDPLGDGAITNLSNAPFNYVTPVSKGGDLLIPVTTKDRQALVAHVGGKNVTLAHLPPGSYLAWPPQMNPSGLVAFSMGGGDGSSNGFRTYLADLISLQPRRVDVKGDVAFRDATGKMWRFSGEAQGNWRDYTPRLNRSGELAFVAQVAPEQGDPRQGILYRAPDGSFSPVALSGDVLPGAYILDSARSPRLYEDGSVLYLAQRKGDWNVGINTYSIYRWDKRSGSTTPILSLDRDRPGGLPFTEINDLWINDQSRKVLLRARTSNASDEGLYLVDGTQIREVAVVGKTLLPGGGKPEWLPAFNAVTEANPSGQRLVFIVGSISSERFVGVYAMNADGDLSLVAKPGMEIDLGTNRGIIESIAVGGAGPNDQGQVVLSMQVRESDRSRWYVVLLKPTYP
jgi:hypothetical protein